MYTFIYSLHNMFHWLIGKPMEGADVNDLTAFWCISGSNIVGIYDSTLKYRDGLGYSHRAWIEAKNE